MLCERDDVRVRIGDYRLPTKRDFIILAETADRLRKTDAERIAARRYDWEREQKDKACTNEARDHDFNSYYFNLMHYAENRHQGSGWHPISFNGTVGYKTDAAKWLSETVEVKDASGQVVGGYRRIERAQPVKPLKASERTLEQERTEHAEELRRHQPKVAQ
jgi:hypothetical protein